MRLLWITLGIVLADQLAKIIVLKNMYRGQSIPLAGDWLKFTFTENPGMAFGITFGPPMTVTVFSIIATLLIIFYMYQVRKGFTPYRVSLALVLGGAIGNIIDRVFYGAILGYGDMFVGKVVDFIHVNIWRGYLPDELPFIGGAYVALFPIWNVADMAIVLGVVGILLFQKQFHQHYLKAQEEHEAQAASTSTSPSEERPDGLGSTSAVTMPEAPPSVAGTIDGEGGRPHDADDRAASGEAPPLPTEPDSKG